MVMPIAEIRARLEANKAGAEGPSEAWPAVRLFTPLAESVWLLSQIDARDPDKAFGLCDEGDGSPHLGPCEPAGPRQPVRSSVLPVRWDPDFTADRPLSSYASDARKAGRIRS